MMKDVRIVGHIFDAIHKTTLITPVHSFIRGTSDAKWIALDTPSKKTPIDKDDIRFHYG